MDTQHHGITTDLTPNGHRYRLPERPLPYRRLIGGVVMAMGLGSPVAGCVFSWIWVSGALSANPGGSSGARYFILAVGFLPLAAGLGSAWLLSKFGTLMGFGGAEVTVEREEVVACDRWGPFAWTRRIRAADIDRFEIRAVVEDRQSTGGTSTAVGQWLDTRELVAHRTPEATKGRKRKESRRSGNTVPIAVGFPEAVLTKLAGLLGSGSVEGVGDPVGLPDAPLLVIEPAEGSDHLADQPPPGRSTLEHTITPDGVSIAFPPRGWRGSKGIVAFTVVWNGFVLLWTIGASIGAVAAIGKGQWAALLFPLFSLPFWAVGVFLIQDTRSRAKRRAMFDVVGGELLISEERLRGVRSFVVPAERIRTIKIGPSGTEINGEPIMELQVHLRDKLEKAERKKCPGSARKSGAVIGLLSERDDDVIEWTAAVLRRALGVGAAGGEE